jgi:vacuolar-type H+-ATPase subunit C/Vma6
MEQALEAFRGLRNNGFWDHAIATFLEQGSTTELDARADEYLLTLAREASYDMFSSASLVFYYLLCRQAAANIRTIVVGKDSGLSDVDIRANLRLAYVNN